MNAEIKNEKYSESINHLLIKKFLEDNLPLSNNIEEILFEEKIGNRRADIFIKLENGKNVIIEIQNSKLSVNELQQRTMDYNQESKDNYVFWILNGAGEYKRKPKNEDELFSTDLEKQLQLMYRGQVFYLNASSKGIESPVYALHFAPFIQQKISSFGFNYYKKLTNKMSAVYNKIPSLQLKLFRNQGFHLACFSEEDPKTKCEEEVDLYLKVIMSLREAKQKEGVEIYQDGIPLILIIEKYREKYGLYLLFNVLQKLKLLYMQDAFFMFRETLWSHKNILL